MEERKVNKAKAIVTMVKATGKVVVGNRPPTERNWQECPDRNWAAVFGYGKSDSAAAPSYNVPSKKVQHAAATSVTSSNLKTRSR